MDRRYRAILLLGPTGAGKTPLGDYLEEAGLWNARCLHFDFGYMLRGAAAKELPIDTLDREDIELIQQKLDTNALLEDEEFHIAERIFAWYVDYLAADAREDCIVMNGLPRHVGQAEAVDGLVRFRAVVSLECDAATVKARIANNAGGDRAGRADDSIEEIKRKLSIFTERTIPLLGHYMLSEASIYKLGVDEASDPQTLWQQLHAMKPPKGWRK